eukprot:COSAG01_NODE_1873_length_8995_cov_7.542299_15_plen_197_part_00
MATVVATVVATDVATVVRWLSAVSDATMVFLPAPPCTCADLCAGVWHCCLPQVVSDWNYFPTLCSGGTGPLPQWCPAPAPAPAAAAASGTTAAAAVAAAADKKQPVVGSSLAVIVDAAAGWSGAIGCMHSTPAQVARETAPLRRRAQLLACTSGAGGDGRGRGAAEQGAQHNFMMRTESLTKISLRFCSLHVRFLS